MSVSQRSLAVWFLQCKNKILKFRDIGQKHGHVAKENGIAQDAQ